MIIGIGIDVVDSRRIEKVLARFPQRFLTRCYTPSEREFYATLCQDSPGQSANHKTAGHKTASLGFLAKRFAAKEAVLKALGTGLTQGISWLDIEVLSGPDILAYRDRSGFSNRADKPAQLGFQRYSPNVRLMGRALQCLAELVPQGYHGVSHVSLTDEPPYASAFVILEAVKN